MSYQVLARKWRPKNFDEMAGQAHVLQTLKHALEQQRLHHAYLFTGTRGVGKTTVARILARCLNCETGITASPCGQCDSCKEISEGRFIDLIEVDAASRTRVEDTRELLDNVQYAPSRGRFKVYLIDEVHMLSTHSFNALLKTLEEPPPHVKFLLATTDPQKLPVTVLSRCLQFHLKNLAPQQIVSYLQSVLTAEQIGFEEEALWQLARAANGSMRDALTLLDQSISFGAGYVRSDAVTALLGTPDHSVVFAVLMALGSRDASSIVQQVADAAENNPDFQRLLELCLAVLHRIALAQAIPDAIDNSEGDKEQIFNLAELLAPADVQLYYQFAVQSLQEMMYSADKRMSFEMCLLRMLAFSPDLFGSDWQEKKKRSETLTISSAESKNSDTVYLATPVTEAAISQTPEPQSITELTSELTSELSPEPEPEPCPELLMPPVQVDEGGGSIHNTPFTDHDWFSLVQRSGLTGISGNILWNCIPLTAQGAAFELLLDEQQSALFSPDHCDTIAQALSDCLSRTVTVAITIGQPLKETPALRRAREKSAALEALQQSFYNDPGVVALVSMFDAKVENLRIDNDRI
jgi:DNA polymerase III subunit gamma/tau